MAGSIRSLGDYWLTELVVWSLGGCGLAGLGGCGLMPKSHGVGLVQWWCGLVGSGGCGFFGFYLEFGWLWVDALVARYGSGMAVRW